MNPVIEQIYSSGSVEDAEGQRHPLGNTPVTFETGRLLYEFVRKDRPAKTLEVGMAYGLSTLFVCQAHRDGDIGRHVSIDPGQRERYRSIGRLNLERAGLGDLTRFFDEPSADVLPRMCAQGESIDFAFIDGCHLFDYVLLDFFYIDKLLAVGGHIAFDDLWLPGVRKALSFILRNRAYGLVPPPSEPRPSAWRGALRIGRRIAQDPLGRDWNLKLLPRNVAFIAKIASDDRGWKEHRAF